MLYEKEIGKVTLQILVAITIRLSQQGSALLLQVVHNWLDSYLLHLSGCDGSIFVLNPGNPARRLYCRSLVVFFFLHLYPWSKSQNSQFQMKGHQFNVFYRSTSYRHGRLADAPNIPNGNLKVISCQVVHCCTNLD